MKFTLIRWLYPRNLQFGPHHSKTVVNVAKHKIVPNCLMTPVTEKARCVTPFLDNRPPKVIIVGGGLAGVSAAEKLEKAGIHDVTILEAQKEMGGRIKTCKLNRTNIELGAYQIEGASVANPIYNLSNIECLLCPRLLRGPRKGYYFTTDGRLALETLDASWFCQNILAEAASFFVTKREPPFWNLHDFVEEKLRVASENLPDEARQDFTMAVNGLMNCLKAKVGEDLKNISLSEFGSTVQIPGGFAPFPGGAIGLVKTLDNCNVELGKVVQKICYGINSPEGRVLVQCCDGSSWKCDYVIVTVSLGVLKALADFMFFPNLPPLKKSAIERIGFGYLTVIHFQFSNPFWNKGENFTMKISWSKSEVECKTDWIQGVCSITEVIGPDHILKVTIVGKEAEWVEKLSTARVTEDFTTFLRQITGDKSLPCPTHIVRSNWCSNLYFLGTKSYLGLGSSVADQCALAEPLPEQCGDGPPTVLFAGEATVPGYFGTLQGARLSGIREADRIIELTIALRGAPKFRIIEPRALEPCIKNKPLENKEPEIVCPNRKKEACEEPECVDPCLMN